MKAIVIKTTTLVTTEVFAVEARDSQHYPTTTDNAITAACAIGAKPTGADEVRTVKFQVMEAK